MALSSAQKDQIETFLSAKKVRHDCPSCGSTKRVFGDVVALPFRVRQGSDRETHMVQVVCDNCAHVRLFLAGPMGLIPRE